MPHSEITCFVVRVIHQGDEVRITVQNLRTRRLLELSSWEDALWVLQQPPPPTLGKGKVQRRMRS